MSKAQLQADQAAYDQLIAMARREEADGRFADAIAHAVSAWQHVSGMMKYERRWEEREFTSVPCIDIVLRLAPLILDWESLDRLADLLKGDRSIDRNASDDLAARLAEARGKLQDVLRLWRLVETEVGIMQSELRTRLGGEQERWRGLAEQLDRVGIIIRVPHGGSYRLWLATLMDAMVNGRCPSCGVVVRGRKSAMLEEQSCPKCGGRVTFVIIPGRDRSLEEDES